MANRVEGGGISHPAPPPPRKRPSGKVAGPGPVKSGNRRAPQRKPSYTPKRPTPPSRNRSGGGGGGGGGGGLSSTAAGAIGSPSIPAAPSINDYLSGDDTYQSQQAALIKALANYRSQMGERQDEYTADFTRRLGDLNLAETRNTADQADDYAGRGLFISGLYGKARGDLERDFDSREGDMNMAKGQFMAGLNRDFTNFNEENNLSKEKAKADALNRRSLQYML